MNYPLLFAEILRFRAELLAGPPTGAWFETDQGAHTAPCSLIPTS